MEFEGKVVAVTGGASGIGFETARLLALRGATVHISDIQQEALESAVKDITSSGGRVIGTVVNVRSRTAVENWISSIVQTHGRLDGAANIAGVGGRQMPFTITADIEDDDFDFVMDVNVKGVLNCMRAELRAMGEGGSIVNASSHSGSNGTLNSGAYVASKHAVLGLTRTAANEYGPKGIRLNAIAPGIIDTPLIAGVKDAMLPLMLPLIPMGRPGKPSEVAEVVAFLLSDRSSYVSGTLSAIDGSWDC